ncbi:MAG: phage Gp37/Gp68 family protein [Defluviitaleaceae bacterium]|nr:phage Gp37/Gp68 family protein [Defluviitaleaceae bacterium]
MNRLKFKIIKLITRRAASNKRIPFRKLIVWEPWVGCTPVSEACKNCYYAYRSNTILEKTSDFARVKFTEGKSVVTGFMSDWFHPSADQWRAEMWRVIKDNPDVTFLLLTKRIERFYINLPDDWGSGYANVIIGVTVENQYHTDIRLPILLDIPARGRFISCSPLLENINIESYLKGIQYVSVAGEVAKRGRILDFGWIVSLKNQCDKFGTEMFFKDTGSLVKVNGVVEKVPRLFQRRKAKKLLKLIKTQLHQI